MKRQLPNLAAILSLSLVACSHAQVKKTDAAAVPLASAQAQSTAAQPAAAQAYKAQGQSELDKALADLQGVKVFFQFDDATLTTEAEQKLGAVAEILGRHPELRVSIAGNCDERGSDQYNLALGQRRAESARKYLTNLGVTASQITALSFGAEKPAAAGHDEQAWKLNRRDDLNAQQ